MLVRQIVSIIIIILAAMSFFPGRALLAGEEIQWTSASDPVFEINGLPWFHENDGSFFRLPKRAKSKVRVAVWNLAQHTSGVRVRFKTDSTILKLRITHGVSSSIDAVVGGGLAMYHMSSVGVSGIDLYQGDPVAMDFWKSNVPADADDMYESLYFEGLPRKLREFTLYLPVYQKLKSLEIGLDRDAKISPPTQYTNDKPVVFYGTSITQSGCATRGSNGFVPLVGRMLGIDVVNLGFSGNGKCEPELADLISEIDAACYVIDPVANMSPTIMQERYDVFVDKIREKHPQTPIVLMTRIRYAKEFFEGTAYCEKLNRFVYETYGRLRQQGDENVYLFDSSKVIPLGGDHPSVDGVHLSDLGFKMLADKLAPMLKEILALKNGEK